MPSYSGSVGRNINDKLGETPSVLDLGAVADLIIANDGAVVASDATFTSASASFSAADIGKRIVIYGAGANTGRESLLREGNDAATTTSSWAPIPATQIDCSAASKIIVSAAAKLKGASYQVFGANASDFSDEVSVLGPTTVLVDAWNYQTISSPVKTYYRVKVQDAVSGDHATVFVSFVAFGWLLGTTIASVNSPTSIELATPASATLSNARWFYGTDNTAAIQSGLDSVLARLNLGGGDGGGTLYLPPGQYLISDTLVIPKTIELRGANMAASAIFADPEAWTDGNYMVKLGPAIDSSPAVATRIVDLRLNGNWAPCSGVYSQQVQESAGVFRCSIVNWRYKGIRFYYFGCQHFTIQDLWVWPSSITLNDDTVVGIELDTVVSSNPIQKVTALAQGAFGAGKGTAIRIFGCNCSLYDIHTENALKGVHFDTGSTGTVINNTGHYLVDSSIYITTTNDVGVFNSGANSSKNNIYDAVSGASVSGDPSLGGRVPQYLCGPNIYLTRGPNNSSARIAGWVPGNATSGNPATYIDGRGNLATDGADPTSPNVVTLNSINFGGPSQGGFLSVNSRIAAYPDWEKTSTNASDFAMFMRLGASLFEVMFGTAANSGGATPGTSAIAVDVAKTIINRLYFAADGGSGPTLPVGNDLGVHRLRLYHGDTGQARFIIQRSQDSGSTWGDIAKFHLDTDKTELLGDLYLKAGAAAIIVVSGDPSGSVSIGPGTLALSTDGTLWFKTGSGTAGWIQIGGGALKGDSLALDAAHPFLRVKKSTVLKFEIDEDGKVTQCASLNIDSAAPAITLKNGGTQKFGVDGSGNVAAAQGVFDAPALAKPLSVKNAGAEVFDVSAAGVTETKDLTCNTTAIFSGTVALTGPGVTAGQYLKTNASTQLIESVAGGGITGTWQVRMSDGSDKYWHFADGFLTAVDTTP